MTVIPTLALKKIRKSEPADKPDIKKSAVDENFQTKKPWIDTRTGKWLWGYTYNRQEYKDEFSEGPYGSNINSSEDEWVTRQHEMNTMYRTIDDIISESNKIIN